MKLLINKNIDVDGIVIYISLYKLHKSFLLLISDQENMGIGSVTMASPPITEGLKSTVASYRLFGVEKKLLSTIIAEKASSVLKAPVLLLLFLKIKKKEEELVKPLVDSLKEILSTLMDNL